MKILIDENKVVVAKANEIELKDNGFFIKEQDITFAPQGLSLIETKLNPQIQKDLFVDGKIEINPNYKTIREIEFSSLVNQKLLTKEQYKTLTGKDFVV